jgi:hypothetical protein
VNVLLEWLKDLLTIFTWKEFWILMSVPTALVGVWFLFCLLLAIPNDIVRTLAIWLLIFVLTLGAATVDALKRQQSKV